MYKAAIYCRLSRDDDNYSESESIVNQKRMLTRYAEEHGWEIYDIYIDDGISGTTFDRSDFTRMIEDIEVGKVNLVLTKDLSRLGRDYIKTGHFIEVFFPEKNVRYIAVNDGIDTYQKDNDIAPFKNILNEMYAKDISKKVRAAFRTKVENGEFIGAFAPYGYRKDPENKNRLVIDDYAADIVRRIYSMCIEGYGLNKIARTLNDEGILNPTMYKRSNGLAYINNKRYEKTSYWTDSTIRRMLCSRVYIGHLEQGKQRTKSFKCKKKIDIEQNDWVVVEDSHEPIIDRKTWEEVQELLKVRRREMKTGETHLFSGMIVCEDCGRFMALNKHHCGFLYFTCSTYKRFGPTYCTSHRIRYDHLCSMVLHDIRYHAEQTVYDEKAIANRLIAADRVNRMRDGAAARHEYQLAQKRVNEIDEIFKKLYEDRAKGTLTERRFSQLGSQYEEEQQALLQKMNVLGEKLKKVEESAQDFDYWMAAIKKYSEITELNKTILGELVEKIIIGERLKTEEETTQSINIVYRFVGSMG